MKAIVIISFISLLSCSPTVKVQALDKPMEINLNIKIDHKITVKVDKELDNIMNKNDDIF